MRIALLGYGKEGQSTEKYFADKAEIDVFENFTPEEIKKQDFSAYDMVFRSPSVPPLGLPNETSVTKYFFEHCPCPIIGVTATKGKGTTCSFIKAILDAAGENAHLVGNIGTPAIDVLGMLTKDSVVVYELSSFQLWDIDSSPHVAVLGQLEPDHLNVHKGYADYLTAKANICRHQTADDYLVYFEKNPETAKIADLAISRKVPYPFDAPTEIQNAVKLPGEHNLDNALAAIAAVACYKNISPDEYLSKFSAEIIRGLESFKGLPHRLEYLRELNGVEYYDDNFSTTPSSTRVAINAFPNKNLVTIIGGRDKTDNEDLPEIYEILSTPEIKKIILIGESGRALAEKYDDRRFIVAKSLKEALDTAKSEAEKIAPAIVLMSPAAASFDMFENVYDRGEKFQNLVTGLDR